MGLSGGCDNLALCRPDSQPDLESFGALADIAASHAQGGPMAFLDAAPLGETAELALPGARACVSRSAHSAMIAIRR